MSDFGKIELSEIEIHIIAESMKYNLEEKGMAMEAEDVFNADFMETAGQEARVLKRLQKWLEYQEQKRDEKEKRS
jgi:homogentisate 1,2-dioxygenase